MADPSLFVDTSGSVVPVLPEHMEGAQQLGWTPATPEQVKAHVAEQKYGTPGQQAITALEGAGRGLTGRLSTGLETHLGVKPEDIQGREQTNPLTSTVSEGAALGASLFVPGLDAFGAPALIAKAGKAASALGGASKVARAAVALGTEGALYGAGQVAHEAALGDPALTAESAMATVGMSALLGGGLGAAGGIVGHLARSAAASSFGDRVLSMMEDAEGHANLNATNAMPAVIKATIKNKGDAVAIGREARDLGILHNPITDSPAAILDRAETVAKNSGQAIDDLAAKASAAPVTDWQTIEKQVVPPVTAALRKQGATFALADQFEQRMAQYGQAYSGRALDTTALLGLKRDLAQFIYTNKATLDVWAKEINTPMKRALDHVAQMVEDNVQSQLGSDGLAALRQSNRAAEVAMTFKTLAESGVARDAANNYVHASGMLGAVAGASALGPAGLALGVVSEAARRRGASAIGATLAALRDANTALAGKLNGAATSLVSGASKAAKAEVLSELSDSQYADKVKQLRQAAIPEVMLNQIGANTGDLHDHAPNVAQQYAIAHARAVQYINSKIPPDVNQGPLAKPPTPTQAQKRNLAQLLGAAEDPAGVIARAAPAEIAHVAALYPAIHATAGTKALSKTAALGPAKVPRSKYGPLSAVVGSPMHSAVSGQAIMRNQALFASPPPAARPSQKGLQHLDVADRAMTPSQRSAQRR